MIDSRSAFVALCIFHALAFIDVSAQNKQSLLDRDVQEQWLSDGHYSSDPIDDAQWWKRFDDQTLDSLIGLAVERNYNLAIAARRIEIARQDVRSAQSAYYPKFGLDAGWARDRQSGAIAGKNVPASISSYWNGGINMSWEIDLFGKITASGRQRKSQLRVSKAEYGAAMVSLQAQMATYYINLRVYQAEMDVALEHSENQLQVVHITEARHKAGLASMLDVAQAKTVYYSTVASIPLLENSIRTTINSIAILLGQYPTELYEWLSEVKPLPNHLQLVATGVPLDLLSRRPDVVAARQNVSAAADALGIAKKDYLPTLTLNGSVGTSAHDVSNLFKNNSFTYTIAPTLSWTIFDGFARKSATATAKENMEIEIDNYNLTVMTAVEETDNAMSAYVHDLDYLNSIGEVVNQSEEAERLSLDLYKRGLSPFTNVVDAQLNVLEYQNSLIVAKGDALVSLVNLYKALGGGWNNDIQ